jgi:hypothetical protein
MSLDIFRESLWIVWKLAFRYRLRRRPLTKPESRHGEVKA